MNQRLSAAWRRSLLRAVALLVAAAGVGNWLDQLALALIAMLLALALWNGLQLWRLVSWLAHSRRQEPPASFGLWAGIFDALYRLRSRNRQSRRRMAEILREFRRATSALPDGTVVINDKDQIVWLNRAAGRFLGLELPKDARRQLTNLIRSRAFSQWLSGQPDSERLELISPLNDHQRLSLQLIPYDDAHRLIVVRDVTQIHRLEQVRRDFVANVSHELRTPLTVIAGYVEALEGDMPEEYRGVLAEVGNQATRMRHIVEDLLAISRLDSGLAASEKGQIVNIRQLLESIKADAQSVSDGRHQLIFHAPAALNLVGSEKDIQSAISNLVVNAIHYTPDGGQVEVTWRATDDGGATLAVCDTGCGIPDAHVPRLTERFYRVSADRSRETGGTGLGLAIVKNVLEQHEGSLQIESELGAGSCFCCHFPARRVVESEPVSGLTGDAVAPVIKS